MLSGKLLVDTTVPLVPPKLSKVQMPAAGSAAQEAKEIVGDDVEVAAAFQNVSYKHLLGEEYVECDVLVTGTSKKAREEALTLVAAADLTGWDAGPLENSVVVEGLSSVLININRLYGSKHAGIRITGVTKQPSESS
jgi:NADPH-dependent F420 reductase